jgi:hypothetical protein
MHPADKAAAIADGLLIGDLKGMPRARLQALADAFYRAHVLLEQAAGQAPYSRVVRAYERQPERPAGVSVGLKAGKRAP